MHRALRIHSLLYIAKYSYSKREAKLGRASNSKNIAIFGHPEYKKKFFIITQVHKVNNIYICWTINPPLCFVPIVKGERCSHALRPFNGALEVICCSFDGHDRYRSVMHNFIRGRISSVAHFYANGKTAKPAILYNQVVRLYGNISAQFSSRSAPCLPECEKQKYRSDNADNNTDQTIDRSIAGSIYRHPLRANFAIAIISTIDTSSVVLCDWRSIFY
ncbi:hypothetical protein A8V01_10845 [Novosphingobium guangzhouense]|uniref:Uncharacterized protein n=1 Tax=Novosphingobium guangzhouense TaxID=1850347 RepID=A0A2K2FT38_9SPHN|nr:hypothetical protein A8V01_10845 [Novosphingobium guangzhouense]